ncbi:unnamed protein product, partial [Mesorhabditis belari]|uniref:Tetraspanin n=1 Tax=Mesorhabditis belari TaxID=2138241 RepID=A0AAF3EXX6_9BILA
MGRRYGGTLSDDSYGSYLTTGFHGERRSFDSTSSDDSEKSGVKQWARYGIFFSNVVFMVVGTVIMVMGAWLRIDSRFRDFLSERYRRVVQEAFWEAPTLYMFSYILIILGAFMFVVAIMGCCGANVDAKPFLVVYTVFVFLLLIATLSSGIYILYKRDGIDVEVEDALNYMVQHYYQGAGIVQESLDHLQQTFRCCGNAGCSDFRAFRQDPPRTCDIRCDGCHIRIWNALIIGFGAACVVFFFVLICEALSIVLAMYLILRPETRIQVTYYKTRRYEAPPSLTRENLKKHDLPHALRRLQ